MSRREVELAIDGIANLLWPSPSGQFVGVSMDNGTICLIDADSMTASTTLVLRTGAKILHIAWSNDDSQVSVLYECWGQAFASICDSPNLSRQSEIEIDLWCGPFDNIEPLSSRFSADGTRLAIDVATNGYQCKVSIFETQSRSERFSYLFNEHEAGEIPYLDAAMGLLCLGSDRNSLGGNDEAQPEDRNLESWGQYFGGIFHDWNLKLIDANSGEIKLLSLGKTEKYARDNADALFGPCCFSADEKSFFAQPIDDARVFVVDTTQRRITRVIDSQEFAPLELASWSVPNKSIGLQRFDRKDLVCAFEIDAESGKVWAVLPEDNTASLTQQSQEASAARPRIALEIPDQPN